MTLLTTSLCLAFIAVVYFSLKFASEWRHRRAIWAETQRAELAQVRRTLVRLVYEGQLDPKSRTFALLYILTSTMIRRSRDYEKAAEAFFAHVDKLFSQSKPEAAEQLVAEINAWTVDTENLVGKALKATFLLIFPTKIHQTAFFILAQVAMFFKRDETVEKHSKRYGKYVGIAGRFNVSATIAQTIKWTRSRWSSPISLSSATSS